MKSIKQYITEFININNVKKTDVLQLVTCNNSFKKSRPFIIIENMKQLDEICKTLKQRNIKIRHADSFNYKDTEPYRARCEESLENNLKYYLSINQRGFLHDFAPPTSDHIIIGELDLSDFNLNYWKNNNYLM